MFDKDWTIADLKARIARLEKQIEEKDRRIESTTALYNKVVDDNQRLKKGRK